MRIGYCTDYSDETVQWAAKVGFTTLEIGYMAEGATAWKKARQVFEEHGMLPMSVFHFDDYGHPDPKKARNAIQGAKKAMKQCVAMGAPVLACNAMAGHTGSWRDKMRNFKKIFTPLAKMAEDMGLKIAIENCPHGGHNIASSPEMWEIMFNEVPNEALGLEYDPSHLIWLGIDHVAALEDFASRVYAFHAKDTEVYYERLKYCGIMGENWNIYRIPGWGEVDWHALFTRLWVNGYEGDITIEHEDPVFSGARMREGLVRGLSFLEELAESPPTAEKCAKPHTR